VKTETEGFLRWVKRIGEERDNLLVTEMIGSVRTTKERRPK
jgi:hypothetical protein